MYYHMYKKKMNGLFFAAKKRKILPNAVLKNVRHHKDQLKGHCGAHINVDVGMCVD